jgi:hypothetical protein
MDKLLAPKVLQVLLAAVVQALAVRNLEYREDRMVEDLHHLRSLQSLCLGANLRQ